MRAIVTLGVGLSFFCCGCMTHRFLGRNLTKQTATVSGLLQQQVLNNVAMFAANRDSLPSFSTIGDGVTQTQDSGFAQPTSMWNATGFTGFNLPLQAQRQLMENWKLQPVMSAGRLMRMRCAYQLLLERPTIALGPDELTVCVEGGCTNCLQELVKVQLLPAPSAVVPNGTCLNDTPDAGCWKFTNANSSRLYIDALQRRLECVIPTGWFCVGCEAPHDACCVGCCGDCYAWVTAGGSDGLARFTLTVLALATLDPPPKQQEMTVYLEQRAKLNSALEQLSGELQHRKAAAVQGELQDSLKQLSEAIEGGNLTPDRKAQLQQDLSRLRTSASVNRTTDENEARLRDLIERAKSALSDLPPGPTSEPTGAFDRPGSMPMSRGGSVEYSPLSAPAAP